MLRKRNYASPHWASADSSAFILILPNGLRVEYDNVISILYPEGCSMCCVYRRVAPLPPHSPFTEGPWCHKLVDGSCDRTNAIQLSEDLAMVVMEPPITYVSL